MSFTLGALKKLFPDSFVNQMRGLVLFDIAAMVWGLAFVFKSNSVGQYALANRALRPVADITTRARKITAENLDQTIPAPNVDDEIGRLTATINEMIQRLHSSFAQVKQFSADASHELRTPLTIIRGEIELALRSTKTQEEYRRVLESALEEILRLTSIIDNLLMLAKADQGSYAANFSEVRRVL